MPADSWLFLGGNRRFPSMSSWSWFLNHLSGPKGWAYLLFLGQKEGSLKEGGEEGVYLCCLLLLIMHVFFLWKALFNPSSVWTYTLKTVLSRHLGLQDKYMWKMLKSVAELREKSHLIHRLLLEQLWDWKFTCLFNYEERMPLFYLQSSILIPCLIM